jgi:hypothetical protein
MSQQEAHDMQSATLSSSPSSLSLSVASISIDLTPAKEEKTSTDAAVVAMTSVDMVHGI